MIAPMKKVMLAGRTVDRPNILEVLHQAGVVHVEPVNPEAVQVSGQLLKRIRSTEKISEFLETVHPVPDTVPSSGSVPWLIGEARRLMEKQARIDAERAEVEREYDLAAPWGPLGNKDLNAIRRAGLSVAFFVCQEKSCEAIEADVLEVITRVDGTVYAVAVSKNPILTAEGIRKVAQPPRDVAELQTARDHLDKVEKETQKALAAIVARKADIDAHLEALLKEKRFSEVEMGTLEESTIFVLQGWAPVADADRLRDRLEGADLNVALQLSDPTDDEMPPTKLENPKWWRPIEILYKVLGVTPGYRENDISPFFLPFLTVFTAMLFADAGYGFVMMLALIVGYTHLSAKGVPKQLLNLFIILFAGCVVYGLLTNAYFGTSAMHLTAFDPMSTPGQIFLQRLCFLIGAVHISLAHLWRVKKIGFKPSALGEVGWVLFTWAMYALICVLVLGDAGPAWMVPMFEVSLGLVILFTAPSWNIPLAVGKGLGAALLSVASFLSDIISYIRLWAVGLAAGILAVSFNELAKPLPLVLAAVVLIGAHAMNIALGMVAVFAHGVRLNLLEFSNHVGMEWTGREYDPF